MDKYNFIGYGSLLSHKSLKETIKDKKFKVVILKNYKRIFNLKLSKKYNKNVLNLIKCKNAICNAVMFTISNGELEKLNNREAEYNLEEVNAYNSNSKVIVGKALVSIDRYIKIDNEGRLPSKSYFKLCRDAAYKISKNFGIFWDKTTFLSNGTSVESFIKENPKYLNK